MTFPSPTPPALDRLRLRVRSARRRARWELRAQVANRRRRLRAFVVPPRPMATRHPDPSKARAAAALRSLSRRPSAPARMRTPREGLTDAIVNLRGRWTYSRRAVLRHPLDATRYLRWALELLALAAVCERRGHLDEHPTICPPRACVYCRRCGRTVHDQAPPLPMVPPSRDELTALRHEREYLLARYGLGAQRQRVDAYVDEVAATYGLDKLNAHRLVRRRIDTGEWSP